MLGVFADVLTNEDTNEVVADYLRDKIRCTVVDPALAETLCPRTPCGTEHPCLDTGYYETFNLPHVSLVDLRTTPIETITKLGITTSGRSFDFDVLVFATGFDAITGAIVNVNIAGVDGVTLKDKWKTEPPRTSDS